MKKICLIYLLKTFLFSTSLFSQQLSIVEQDYEKAKQLSHQQNKMLLIDFYTTWCAPCKILDEQLFRNSANSAKIAKDYIVLRYNAEKDSIYNLTKKHHIRMYPSAVVLNANQQVVHQQYGTGGADSLMAVNYLSFLQKAKQLNQDNFFLKGISADLKLAYPDFYVNYINRTSAKMNREELNRYWDTISSLLPEIPFKIFCYFSGGNEKWNEYFFENKQTFTDLYGELDVLFAATMIISDRLYSAIEKVDRVKFNNAVEMVKIHMGGEEKTKKYINLMELRMLQAENRWKDAYRFMEALKKKNEVSPEDIIWFSSNVSDKCEDKTVLNKTAKWVKKITQKQPSYYYLENYALLLFKLGKKEQSLETMKKAIEKGKEENESTKSSEQWISKNFPEKTNN
ncbi:thioredoxin family protein [Gynurincola endophyticus]|uniref:thioredoxin family protein n=1 Tax=Gynurincola endophyticus TaxID=2479004 RepID=UPI000F8D8CCB|nr:thioredoxin family protein [Gynurincola endophyticus]